MRKCEVCGIDISNKKQTARTCSVKCRKDLSRLESVTPNVTLGDNSVTLEVFKFTIVVGKDNPTDVRESKSKVRTAQYWYEVPIAAIPINKNGWPEMPEYMNGRQYFLWWKNDFLAQSDGTPIIHNPFPVYADLKYIQAGENSRHWGTN